MSKLLNNNRNFLIDKEILLLCRKHRLIDPFEQNNLSGNSYDLRVGDVLSSRNLSATFYICSEPYIVESGEVVTIKTYEKVDFFSVLCSGFICNKHSILAKGLFHPITSIDPGFNGELAVTFINLGNTRYKITYGDKISKLFISPLISRPKNIYGQSQRPSYREGSLEIATYFDNPVKPDNPEMYTRMYGEPLRNLYLRMDNIEKELSIADIKTDYNRRKESRSNLFNLIFALISGGSGALLAIYWKDILDFFKAFI